ncbi:hypothetical protein JW935_19685, partial [candidate division KSB1 bacterium]|nr:hypothetical protein [candidate division KSB1 bacterium]
DTYMIYPDTAKDKKHLNTLYKIMAHAGTAPDDFDGPTGLIGDGEMLIGHIYAPNGIGFADFMTQYFYNEAVEAWKKNQKYHAAVYLCYASHYLEDAGIPVHAEADYRNLDVLQWQLGYHSYTESYVADNWSKYSATSDSAAAVPMPVCDISSMVRSLAMETYPDVAGWTKAWGYKGGGDYKKGDEPVNVKMFDELVKQEIWRCVPRVSGMFLKFKTEVMKGGTF